MLKKKCKWIIRAQAVLPQPVSVVFIPDSVDNVNRPSKVKFIVFVRAEMFIVRNVSCQLIGSKRNPTFLPVKIPYRMHSSLNTASR